MSSKSSSSVNEAYTQVVYRQYLSMVAGKCNLDLRFEADACPCTDGKVVVVPRECYEESKRDELVAYVLHEAGHTRFTDFSVLDRTKSYEKELLNAIEDVRIETRMCQMYAGAKGYLVKSLARLMPEILPALAKKMHKASLLQRFTNFVHAIANTHSYAGMYDAINAPYVELTEKGLKMSFSPVDGENLCKEVRDELKCVPMLQSASEVLSCVRRLLKILEKYFPSSKEGGNGKSDKSQPKDKSQDKSKGTGEKKSEDNQSQDKGSNEGNQQQQQNSQNSTDSKGKKSNGKSKKSNSGGKSSSSPSSNGNEGDSQQENKPNFREEMSRDAMQHQGDFNPLDRAKHIGVTETSRDLSKNRSINAVEASTANFQDKGIDRRQGVQAVAEARRKASRLTTALRSFIEAKAETEIDYVSSGSQVKPSRLYRVPTGSMKVFTRKSEDPESTNTAVCILVDTSGSMGSGISTVHGNVNHNNRLVTAELATLALYMALRNLTGTETVSTSVIAFPGRLESEVCNNGHYNARPNQNAVYIVRHGERLTPEIAGHFAEMDGFGCTPINSALEAANVDLMNVTDVTRRVCFVITDGIFHADKGIVEGMHRNGIEIFGLSVDCGDANDMKEALGEKYCIAVDENAEITPSLIALARKAFL